MNNLDTLDAARWLHIIQSEYREMPGLSLTRPQMRRLWGLESDVCDHLVAELIDTHVLRKTANGGYVSAGAA